ncbi:MAG: hypothetical protein B6244_05505 [Candidatus Cloacimonetes bacterium 4572_55]|nr:MAG: hypothetical protein B6244_05505 [Candidatus Cloacimonetes bacterium 4572_55]
MSNRREPLVPNQIFHVYNHANGRDNLFANDGNYTHFFRKYAEYLFPIFGTFAYCLLPNHYHFLIRVKETEALWNVLDPKGFRKPLGSDLANWLAHRVGTLQNAYAKAFNIQQKRKGSLFIQSFCRKPVDNPDYYFNVLRYIHANAVHHDFVTGLDDWPFSSYHTYLSKKPSKLAREEAVSWCGGFAAFKELHLLPVAETLGMDMEDFS